MFTMSFLLWNLNTAYKPTAENIHADVCQKRCSILFTSFGSGKAYERTAWVAQKLIDLQLSSICWLRNGNDFDATDGADDDNDDENEQ